MSAPEQVTRRALLGWAAAIIASTGGVWFYSFSKRENGPFARLARYLQKESARRRQVARKRRKAFRSIEPWESPGLVINQKRSLPEKIVHWPQPKLVKLRYKVDREHSTMLDVDVWDQEVRENSGVRFERRHSGTILETLALSKLEVKEEGGSLHFDKIDQAVSVLEFARALRENQNDRRLGELVARLLCLGSPTLQEARTALKEAKGLPDVLTWIGDDKKIERWYKKTVDTEHGHIRKKLKSRVLQAKSLRLGASSSGKDTA